jgi:hypothetical protein
MQGRVLLFGARFFLVLTVTLLCTHQITMTSASRLSEADILLVCELFPDQQVDAIFSAARNHSSVASLIKQFMDHTLPTDQLNIKQGVSFSFAAPSNSFLSKPVSSSNCSTSSSFGLMNQLREVMMFSNLSLLSRTVIFFVNSFKDSTVAT